VAGDIAILVGAYLIGSFPSNYLTAKLFKGVDLLRTGSGNVGGMNTIRNVGALPGLVGGAMDILKAVLATWLGLAYGSAPWVASAAAVLVVVGHNWMVWLRFRGGKGLGASVGALAMLAPWSLPWMLGLIVVATLILRDTMMGVAVACAFLPAILWPVKGGPMWALVGALLALAVLGKLAEDIKAYLGGRRRFV